MEALDIVRPIAVVVGGGLVAVVFAPQTPSQPPRQGSEAWTPDSPFLPK